MEDVWKHYLFLNSPLLVFTNESIRYDKHTGEEIRTTYHKYINLTICVEYSKAKRPVRLKTKGSFHYLMNDGRHNADNKSFKEFTDFLKDFSDIFNIDLQKLAICPPEFAINCVVPFEVESVVQNIFYEQRKKFENNSPGNPSKISGKVSHDYRLKIYDKHHEHPEHCQPNTLRLEYQAKKMRGLHKLGINTLQDLLDLNSWVRIHEMHMSYMEHLVLFDYLIKLSRKSKYSQRLRDYSNPNWWENLLKKIKKGEEYSTKYNEELATLNFLSKRYGSNLLQTIL